MSEAKIAEMSWGGSWIGRVHNAEISESWP